MGGQQPKLSLPRIPIQPKERMGQLPGELPPVLFSPGAKAFAKSPLPSGVISQVFFLVLQNAKRGGQHSFRVARGVSPMFAVFRDDSRVATDGVLPGDSQI